MLLVEIGRSSPLVVGCEHRLEVGVDYEWRPRAVLPVGEFQLRAGLWHDVDDRRVIVTGAELLVTSQNLSRRKMTEAPLAEEHLPLCFVKSEKRRLKFLIQA